MKYEEFYLLYYKLKNINLKKQITQSQANFFEKAGILIKRNDNYLCLINDEKFIDLDVQFIYTNFHKLDFIFHENNLVKFLINYIIKNIYIYVSIEKLLLIIKKNIGENNYELFGFDESIVNEAHKILYESGICKKKYCFQNRIIMELGHSISIRNIWYFEVEENCDFYQKILNYRLLNS